VAARRVRVRREVANLSARLLTQGLAAARNTWRSLTSMGTALVLLFLLALGAVPGALLPQRSLNAGKVADYLAARPLIGPWLDRLQAFDVFGSFWFTAIYVLLFVSLVGCLTPRTIEHARSLRTTPVAAPRNLARLPKHAAATIAGEPDKLAVTLAARLHGWHKVIRGSDPVEDRGGRKRGRGGRKRGAAGRSGPPPSGAAGRRGHRPLAGDGSPREGTVEISAEKGYLHEFGNLVFHFSLLGLLVAVAVGKLFGYEGNVIVIADGGPGFCSASPAVFDSFRAGNTVDGTSLHPICLRVNDFDARYLPSGQASSFAANVAYQTGRDLATGNWQPYRLEVNHPLRVGGDRVYLQGHGYAPTFSVTFPDGQTRTSTVQWRPDNPQTLLSSGVVRIDPPAGAYPDAAERREHQIAIQGLLAPTEQLDGALLSSRFPALNAPAVAVDIYSGDTGLDSGRPQSLYTLDPRLIDQHRLTKVKRVNLRAGDQVRLGQGPAAGTVVRFDGAVPFVNLQVSHDPGQTWVLVFAIAMMAGLLVSLLVRRRRVWIRIVPAALHIGMEPAPGTVNVELGGLARTDNSGWGDEFERLTNRLMDGFRVGDDAKRSFAEERRA
jgi:cytochrome c biogenesis protein